MKCVCVNEIKNISIEEIPVPQAGPEEALVKVTAVSVCGSDVNAYLGRGTKVTYPLILGHEIAGTIEEIDSEDQKKSGLKPGDTVVVDPYMYCGHCYPCSLGRTNCCENMRVLGVQTDGAMCEYIVHPVNQLVKVSDKIPLEVIPVIEPLTIALHAIHRVALKQGEHVVITGAGAIGLLAAMIAKSVCGAEPILVDVVEGRLAFAREQGINYTINSAECDDILEISKITNARMAEAVIEASGANIAISKSLEYASYCGRIAFTGWPSKDTNMQTGLITKKELDTRGSRNSVHEFEEASELISSGKVNAGIVLSEVVPFEDLPAAIEKLANEPGKYMKIGALL